VALIISAVMKMGKNTLIDVGAVMIFLAVTVLSIVTDLSPAVFVIAAGLIGLLLKGGKRHAASD